MLDPACPTAPTVSFVTFEATGVMTKGRVMGVIGFDRRRARLLAGMVLSAVAVVGAPSPAGAVPIGDDIGTLRTDLYANGWNSLRDSGYSAAFTNANGGTETFWVFGDTHIARPAGHTGADPYPTGDMPAWWRNNTAASGPFTAGVAPTGLQEVGTAGTAPVVPRQLIPDPAASATDTVAGNGTVPCGTGTMLLPWAQGATRIAGTTNQVLIPYSTLCGVNGTVVASGFAQYNAVTEQLVANTPDVFQGASLAPHLALQAPVFGFGENYLYFTKTCLGGSHASCPTTRTYLARVAWGWDPASSRPWLNPANYEWWNGGTEAAPLWTAAGTGPTTGGPSLLSTPGLSAIMTYQPSMNRYVFVEQTDFYGEQVRIRTAAHPWGAWVTKASGETGCDRSGGTYGADNRPVRQCRGIIPHAEFGSSTTVVFSYAQVKNTSPLLEKPTDNQTRLRRVTITP